MHANELTEREDFVDEGKEGQGMNGTVSTGLTESVVLVTWREFNILG